MLRSRVVANLFPGVRYAHQGSGLVWKELQDKRDNVIVDRFKIAQQKLSRAEFPLPLLMKLFSVSKEKEHIAAGLAIVPKLKPFLIAQKPKIESQLIGNIISACIRAEQYAGAVDIVKNHKILGITQLPKDSSERLLSCLRKKGRYDEFHATYEALPQTHKHDERIVAQRIRALSAQGQTENALNFVDTLVAANVPVKLPYIHFCLTGKDISPELLAKAKQIMEKAQLTPNDVTNKLLSQ